MSEFVHLCRCEFVCFVRRKIVVRAEKSINFIQKKSTPRSSRRGANQYRNNEFQVNFPLSETKQNLLVGVNLT